MWTAAGGRAMWVGGLEGRTGAMCTGGALWVTAGPWVMCGAGIGRSIRTGGPENVGPLGLAIDGGKGWVMEGRGAKS